MKKILTFVITLACSLLCGQAQEVVFDNGNTKLYANGCVKSSDGFVEKQARVPVRGAYYYSRGIYSADGSVLIHISETDTYTAVAEGTKAIANTAFNRCSSIVYMPTSVEYIAPKAFESNTDNVVKLYISDEIEEITTSARPDAPQAEADELARYNAKGMRIEKSERGLNIVKLSDNTTRKEIVK